jgi:hypothetical protein
VWRGAPSPAWGCNAALFLWSSKRAAYIAVGIKSIVFKWMILKTSISNRCGQRMRNYPAISNLQNTKTTIPLFTSSFSLLTFYLVYSHSIVPGGFDVVSYTTRFIPRISFTIRFEIDLITGHGNSTTSAVMPSSEFTARIAHVYAYVR